MATQRNQSTETQIKNVLLPVIQVIGRSGKLVYILLLGIFLYFLYTFFTSDKSSSTLEYNSALIEK